MKGFMKDNKFHPITEYKKGTRKSRDQTVKMQGVKIERKSRNFPQDIDEMTESEQEATLEILNLLDDTKKGGLDEEGRELKKELESVKRIRQVNEINKHADNYHLARKLDPVRDRYRSNIRKKRFLTDDDLDRLSDLQLNALLKDVEKKWNKKELYSDEGDHNVIIYTNKSDPNYTFELHPMDDNEEEDEDGNELEEPIYHDAWYWFPAKDKKGIPNSPSTLSETGGYNKKDALREFYKELILYDQEFSS